MSGMKTLSALFLAAALFVSGCGSSNNTPSFGSGGGGGASPAAAPGGTQYVMWRNGVIGGFAGQNILLDWGTPGQHNWLNTVSGLTNVITYPNLPAGTPIVDNITGDTQVLELGNPYNNDTPWFHFDLPVTLNINSFINGNLEFNMQLLYPQGNVSWVWVYIGSGACFRSMQIYPMSLSTTQFTHFSIPVSNFLTNCPAGTEVALDTAFYVSVQKRSAYNGPAVWVNDVKWSGNVQ